MPALTLELELAGDAAVAREDRGAVPVRVVVDEPERLVVGIHAHHGEHRAEDLVPVAVHLGRDAVEQRDAEEEAVAVDVELAAVRDHAGALLGPTLEVGRDLVAVGLRDQRAHLRVRSRPGPDLHLRQAVA